MQQALKHFVQTPCGYLRAATTTVGRTCVVTSHEVVSEGVIVANSLQQDRHFWHIEAGATDQECPELLKPL